ncbi:MAG: hypothetical protein Tsb0021_09260 [Chlamydiales bacterium]
MSVNISMQSIMMENQTQKKIEILQPESQKGTSDVMIKIEGKEVYLPTSPSPTSIDVFNIERPYKVTVIQPSSSCLKFTFNYTNLNTVQYTFYVEKKPNKQFHYAYSYLPNELTKNEATGLLETYKNLLNDISYDFKVAYGRHGIVIIPVHPQEHKVIKWLCPGANQFKDEVCELYQTVGSTQYISESGQLKVVWISINDMHLVQVNNDDATLL